MEFEGVVALIGKQNRRCVCVCVCVWKKNLIKIDNE